jgi:uncharacterized RDD family membrane protein YckC
MSTGNTIDLNHWLLRFIAIIIDSIIIGIVAYILYIFAFLALITGGVFLALGAYLFLPLFLGIIEIIYFVILEVMWGATLGKRIVGLQVQMVNGGKVTADKSLIRNISKIYWLLLALDWILGLATQGSDKRQKYSDRIAGTTVVSVKQVIAPIITT